MGLALALVVALGGGFLLIWAIRPAPGASPAVILLNAALGVGCGLGLSSATWFLWLVLIGPPATGYIAAEVAAVVGLGCALVLGRRRARSPVPAPALPATPDHLLPRVLAAGIGLLLVSAIVTFVVQTRAQPHGPGDAWAIWNLRARFLYRGGSDWRRGFEPVLAWSHPDYPLLVSGAVARCWTFSGYEQTLAPAVLGLLFALATVALLAAVVRLLRGLTQGLLAALVLLGTSIFLRLGYGQMADVPLAFYFLASVGLLCLHDRYGSGSRRGLILAGLMAGFATWTKNEGVLFLACLLPSRLVTRSIARGWREGFREWPALLLGALPMVALLVAFKTTVAPPNDLLAGQQLQATLGRLGDPARYRLIGESLVKTLLSIGPAAVVPLAVAFLLLGRAPPAVRSGSALPLLLVPLMLLGYCGVYLTTPNDLQWHLDTSLYRLLMQLWPLALLGYFLAVAAPGDAAKTA